MSYFVWHPETRTFDIDTLPSTSDEEVEVIDTAELELRGQALDVEIVQLEEAISTLQGQLRDKKFARYMINLRLED
jgi:hypothetical protein